MKALVTGATGFLGRHLCDALQRQDIDVVALGSRDADLKHANSLDAYSNEKYDYVWHLAAWTQAGDFCLHHQGEQWIINQQINTNVLNWWKETQPQAKLIAIGSSCCYEPGTPHTEENFLVGHPIDSLYTYAMTKRMLYVGLRALQQQFGLNYLFLIPSTMYGPHYHNDGRQMHFIFDLIRKISNGVHRGNQVSLWGDGSQRRELIYVRDFVDAAASLATTHKNEIINIGSGESLSIKHYAESLCEMLDYNPHKIFYDTSKYSGAQDKVLIIDKLRSMRPEFEATPLEAGLAETVRWFEETFHP